MNPRPERRDASRRAPYRPTYSASAPSSRTADDASSAGPTLHGPALVSPPKSTSPPKLPSPSRNPRTPPVGSAARRARARRSVRSALATLPRRTPRRRTAEPRPRPGHRANRRGTIDSASWAPHRRTASGKAKAPAWEQSEASACATRASAATSEIGPSCRIRHQKPAKSAGTPQCGPVAAAAAAAADVTARVAFSLASASPRSIAAVALFAPHRPRSPSGCAIGRALGFAHREQTALRWTATPRCGGRGTRRLPRRRARTGRARSSPPRRFSRATPSAEPAPPPRRTFDAPPRHPVGGIVKATARSRLFSGWWRPASVTVAYRSAAEKCAVANAMIEATSNSSPPPSPPTPPAPPAPPPPPDESTSLPARPCPRDHLAPSVGDDGSVPRHPNGLGGESTRFPRRQGSRGGARWWRRLPRSVTYRFIRCPGCRVSDGSPRSDRVPWCHGSSPQTLHGTLASVVSPSPQMDEDPAAGRRGTRVRPRIPTSPAGMPILHRPATGDASNIDPPVGSRASIATVRVVPGCAGTSRAARTRRALP